MNKHEAIKAAYGEQYDSKITNKDGWQMYPYHEPVFDKEKFESKQEGKYFCIRPKSLSGIENNNSWTRIESEEDLPKEPGHYFAIDIFRSEPCIIVFEEALKKNWLEVVSHYQPIDKPKPPIF